MDVEEQARIVSALLKEYVDKLAALNTALLGAMEKGPSDLRAAWLLDQGELLRHPLARIISRGSGLLEHSILNSMRCRTRRAPSRAIANSPMHCRISNGAWRCSKQNARRSKNSRFKPHAAI